MLQQPFIINGKEVYTTVSIGIAVFPKDGIDYSTLINHADHAMYQAKSLGKNQYHCYQSDER
jgi:diguanylate cyclase (GGDEF)-like protein